MKQYKLIFALFSFLLLQSCGVNKDLMFRSPKGEVVKSDSIPLKPTSDYVISPDDKFTFALYTNNGESIINGMSGVTKNENTKSPMEYVVRTNGTADLPIIGNVKVSEMTIPECEKMLAATYAEKNGYKDPFVQVQITNQRVIVFPGSGGDAKVVTIQNNNTTLMEVIALAGGIADRGRADRIKLIREINGVRTMYTLDLSTVEGLKYADLIVQAHDYIYVEPNEEVAKEVVERAAPIVSIVSSMFLIITFLTTLN